MARRDGGNEGQSLRRHPSVDSANRLALLKIVILIAFSVGLAMCPALWIGPRSYPLAPLLAVMPSPDGAGVISLYLALFVLAVLAIVGPYARWSISGFLVIVALFCLADQTRWQPWVFQYCALLAVVAVGIGRRARIGGAERALNVARLIVALTYVFSGLQKINSNFMEYDFPWVVTPVTHLLPASGGALHAFGFAVPLIEVGFGIGLLTTRWRRISLVAAVAMHAFILAMFGPLGLNWNNVVWPWTATMAVFDVVLFSRASEVGWRDIVWNGGIPSHVAALLVFGLLPALSFFNLWDSFLSAALYSGNLTEAQIYLSDSGLAAIPNVMRPRVVHTSPNTNVLNIQRWAIEDLNVTPYAETRVFKAIAKGVCDGLRDRNQLVLIVKEQRMFFSHPEAGYRCAQL